MLRRVSTPVILLGLAASLGALASCNPFTPIAAMAESYKRNSTHTVPREYTGLDGKSFAVLVAADRFIESEHPGLVARLVSEITARLEQNVNASGRVTADQVLQYMYGNPGWQTKSMSTLAAELGGVERIVFVDLREYRLNDPGNQFLWEGVAQGEVSVAEADTSVPDLFAFTKPINVTFPDKKGVSAQQLDRSVVTSELSRRFIDRASWPFYDHEEPYYPTY